MATTVAPPDVRDRILDAALVVLQNEGLQKFTQTRVAAEAKVRQSHLTYYFPTRADLLEGAATRVLDAVTATIAKAAQAGPEWGAAPIFGVLAHNMVGSTHMRMFLAMIIESDRDPAVRDLLVRGSARVREGIAAALGGPDAEQRARVIQVAIWGLGLYAFAHRPTRDVDPTDDVLNLLEEFAR